MTRPIPRPQAEMRRHNLSQVLHTLAEEGPLSRAAVSHRIGLTRAAVSTLVDELLRSGLLQERGPSRPGTVGRPGTELLLTDRGPCGFGAEIGVDQLTVCAMDLRGQVRARITRGTQNRGRAPERVLRLLTAMLRRLTDEAASLGLRPSGLTIAVPGLVTRGTALVTHAPNLGWRDTDLTRWLPSGLGPVAVDNEANLGALAELWSPGVMPRSRPTDSFVHVSADIGIGAAVVIDGELWRGAHGFAGELGHVPIHPDGLPCSCGGRGCLEAYAGETAVLRAAGAEPGPGVRLGTLVTRCAAGEPAALRAVQEAGAALGIALSGAVNLLDPGRAVIGGALGQLAPWLLPPLRRELACRTAVTTGSRAAPVPVTAARAGSDGPLLGAARSAVRAAFDRPGELAG